MPDPLRLPAGLRPNGPGRRFWRAVTGTYEGWRPDELVLLGECCRMVDELEALRGVTDPSLRVERRALRTELRRSLGQLSLPDAVGAEEDELQARRGQQASRRAQHAAAVRWSRQ